METNESQETIEELKVERQKSKTILDASEAMKNGFYAPIIYCLNQGYVTKEFSDGAYSPLHYSIFQNNMAMVDLFMNYFSMDINLKSGSNQTPLMLAVSRKNHYLTKYLLDHNARIEEKDTISMNGLQYALNYENTAGFIILLYKGEDFQSVDVNGCGMVHRAAYKDNKFLLQIFKTFGFPLFDKDNFGFSPIERAISNYSYSAFKYLFKEAVHQDLNLSKITSPGMKAYIMDKRKGEWREGLLKKWNNSLNSKNNQCYFYSAAYFLYVLMLIKAPFPMMTEIWEFILIIFSYIYTIAFIIKGSGADGKRRKSREGFVKLSAEDDEETSSHYDYSRLNYAYNFYKNEKSYNERVLPAGNFLFKIVSLFEREKFKEMDEFDFSNCCPKCLMERNRRTVHCKFCDSCVDGYSHHSIFFGRCITTKTHPFYLMILILQFIVSFSFVLNHYVFASGSLISWRILWAFETIYLYFANEGLMQVLSFLFVLISFIYNLGFLVCELCCVVFALTHHELFNPHKCKYLYQKIDIKSEFENMRYTKYHNPYNYGFLKNILRYMLRR